MASTSVSNRGPPEGTLAGQERKPHTESPGESRWSGLSFPQRVTEGCGRPGALLQRPQGGAPPGLNKGVTASYWQVPLEARGPDRRVRGHTCCGVARSRSVVGPSPRGHCGDTAQGRQQHPNLLSSRSSPSAHAHPSPVTWFGQGSLPRPGQRVIPASKDQLLVTGPAVGPDGRMHRGPLSTGFQILRPHPPHPPGRGASLRTTLRPRPAHAAPAPSAPLGLSRVESVSAPCDSVSSKW